MSDEVQLPVIRIGDLVCLDARLKDIEVLEWCPTPDGSGQPQQVHVVIHTHNLPPIILRFRGRRPLDSLCSALQEHAASVWPPKVSA